MSILFPIVPIAKFPVTKVALLTPDIEAPASYAMSIVAVGATYEDS